MALHLVELRKLPIPRNDGPNLVIHPPVSSASEADNSPAYSAEVLPHVVAMIEQEAK
jgi:hypothetical protein